MPRSPSGVLRLFCGAVLLSVAALTIASTIACGGKPEKDSVLLIVLQGVRADHLGPYGYGKQTSPALDLLAGHGVVFDRAYVSTPSPAASMASLLTGRFPEEHGVLVSGQLDQSIETLPSHLRTQGFETVLFSSDPDLGEVNGLFGGYEGIEIVDPAAAAELDGGSAALNRSAISWMREKRNSRLPFFATLVYSGATLPFSPPAPFDRRFTEAYMTDDVLDRASSLWLPLARRINAGELQIGQADREVLAALYDGELAYLDQKVGELLDELEAEGLDSSTWVIVTADRGEDLGEGGKLADTTSLSEASLRVPLIVKRPQGRGGPSRIDAIFEDVDFVPTICDLLGVRPPATVSPGAVSQAAMDGSDRRADAVSVAVRLSGPRVLDLAMSLREDRFRYLLAPQGPASLLDLEAKDGPAEVLDSSPEVARRLHERLAAWHGMLTPPPGGQLQPAPPPEANPAP